MSAKYPEWWELPLRRWHRPGHKRDSRKQKLYDAENNIRHSEQVSVLQFHSLDEVDTYIRSLINDPWIRKRWSAVREEDFSVTLIPRISGAASARKLDSTIWLPRWAWNDLTVLHEFCHLLTPYGADPGHGRFFARSLLEIVGHKMGSATREILRCEFVKFGVQYQPIKVITPEKLEEMKERGHRLAMTGLGQEVQNLRVK